MRKLISQSVNKLPLSNGIYDGVQTGTTCNINFQNAKNDGIFEFKVNASYKGIVEIFVRDGIAEIYEAEKAAPKSKKRGAKQKKNRGQGLTMSDLKIFFFLFGCVLIFYAFTLL